ncbi:hypothetical protein IW262DRAFT_123473 [Armillaria fumosa]|nr:hypothetical protein IW262DRAFT_123473 [Armillaria fumosa]
MFSMKASLPGREGSRISQCVAHQTSLFDWKAGCHSGHPWTSSLFCHPHNGILIYPQNIPGYLQPKRAVFEATSNLVLPERPEFNDRVLQGSREPRKPFYAERFTSTWKVQIPIIPIIRLGTILFSPEMRMRRDASGHVLISLWGPMIGTSSADTMQSLYHALGTRSAAVDPNKRNSHRKTEDNHHNYHGRPWKGFYISMLDGDDFWI